MKQQLVTPIPRDAVSVQPPGGCNPPNTDAHDPGGHGPHRVEPIAPNQLTPYSGNARTHSKRQIEQIAASIRKFGFNNPVLINDDGQIVAGHGRVEAAKLLGLAAVPTLRLSHLSPAEQRAYVLADNKLAENAGWDRELLAIELQGLIDLDFEVELTGFEIPEIDIVLEDADAAKAEGNGPKTAFPTLYQMRVSPSPATCGSWVNTASSAAMLSMSRTMDAF